jgi:ATP-dependent exoDNAse (exonuclease V) beta subunit
VSAGPSLEAVRAADGVARLRAQTSFAGPLVIEAGAGTGKTATLVARIVAWCLGPGWRRAAAELAAQPVRPHRAEAPAAERIAARVLDGVVAITFTEAAAAEMASRVAKALAEVRVGRLPTGLLPEALVVAEGESEPRAAALLVALDHLVVATIHAFCRRLLADAPLEAGLHPAFTVDAEGRAVDEVARETVESAFRTALAGSEEEPLVALAVRGFGPAEVADALAELAAAGVPPSALAEDPLAPAAVAALVGRVRGAAAEVDALVGRRVGGLGKTAKAIKIANGCAALGEAALGTLSELVVAVTGALPDALVERLGEWGRGRSTGREAEALADVAADLRAPAGYLAVLAAHVARLDPELLATAWRAIGPLYSELDRTLRARGAETFAALLRDARDLLADRPAVRAAVRAGMTQLLVDEFQDTDRLQCEIVRLLALDGPPDERPGLFLIGDPKQSIYGWRNADLAAYDAFLDLVRENGGEAMGLAVNFRSLPPILDEVRRVVEPAMVRQAGVQPPFQPLIPSAARAAARPAPGGRRAAVEHWVSWDRAEGSDALAPARPGAAAEIEARALAADIRELHGEGVAWREIGVLLRATGSLDVVVGALRDAGVPHAVERDRSYYRRREVIEAAALVRTVLDPADHLALVTVLRSSLVGVPDAALVPLWARGLPDHAGALPAPDKVRLGRLAALVEEAAGALPAGIPGLARVAGWERNLTAFLAQLAELRRSFATEPAAVFVERLRTATLFEASEAARALGAYRTANLDRFFRGLLEGIESGGEPQAIVRGLRSSVAEAREALEGRPFAAAEDAVRVMTIHKAKGLDFAHVYLLQAHGRPRGGSRLGTGAEEIGGRFEYALLGACTPGWHEVEARRRRVEEAELVRTLYVAMTRAKDRLVVAGSWPVAPAVHARPRSHMDVLARRAPSDGLAALAAELSAAGAFHADREGARWVFPALGAMEDGTAANAALAPPLPAPEQVARDAELLAGLRTEAAARMARPFSAPASEEAHRRLRELLRESAADPAEESPGTAAARAAGDGPSPASAAGAAVHRVLEALDLDAEIGGQLAAARGSLTALVEGLIAPAGRREAERRAAEVLASLAAGPLLGRLRAIAPHVVARELAVLLPAGDAAAAPAGFVAGAIDLLYRDPDTGEFVVADYKTDEVADATELDARAAAYAPQGAVYRRALEEALKLSRPPGFELWFLQAGAIVRFP